MSEYSASIYGYRDPRGAAALCVDDWWQWVLSEKCPVAPAEEFQSHFGFLSPTDTWQSRCLVIEPPKKSPSVRNLYNGISGALSGKQLKKNQSHNKTFRPAYLAPLCPWCPHTHSCPLSGLSWAELLSTLPGLPLPPWGPATQVSSRKCQKIQKC